MARPAENDLVDVAAWYAERHPSGEEPFFVAFGGVHDLLARQPRIGREQSELREGLQSWFAHPYVVFYVVNDDAHVVTIERVIHGHMDIGEDDFDG